MWSLFDAQPSPSHPCPLPALLQHEEYNNCVCGEEVAVIVNISNPTAIKLKVRCWQWQCGALAPPPLSAAEL